MQQMSEPNPRQSRIIRIRHSTLQIDDGVPATVTVARLELFVVVVAFALRTAGSTLHHCDCHSCIYDISSYFYLRVSDPTFYFVT
jgi:hypothetical protein